MKQRIILAGLLLMAGMQTSWAQNAMKVWQGGSFELYYVSRVDSVSFVNLVSEVKLSQDNVELEKGETVQLTATVLPENASDKTVTWESSNPTAATVDEGGLVTAKGGGWTNIICKAADGSGTKAQCYVKVNVAIIPGSHEYVDLGLPSGTLWATCNVGANSPEEYGDYFAWGETEPKDNYKWSTYRWCNGEQETLTKYCTQSGYGYNGFTDGKEELDAADDAATANWGTAWQMPSVDQLTELYNSSYTTTEWTTQGGVDGRLITSRSNGKTLFLPVAGCRYNATLGGEGSYGFYWSRSLYTGRSDNACYLYFHSSYIGWIESVRVCGGSIRPVRK